LKRVANLRFIKITDHPAKPNPLAIFIKQENTFSQFLRIQMEIKPDIIPNNKAPNKSEKKETPTKILAKPINNDNKNTVIPKDLSCM
jgi:hypothetical protein|tara:strand:+ start:242 stop:502 length:261 start_codon:yes stop_codon:yes gene_type:complete